MTNVLVISGSRNPEGQTATAIQALLRGAAKAGSTGDVVYLPQKQIERCRQCDVDGWGLCKKEGRCVIEDDFASLFERIKQAGAVVFATPVYFSDLAESLRAFLDRLRRISRNETAGAKLAGKKAVGICVAGGGGGGAPLCISAMDRIVSRCGFDVLDMVAVRRQNREFKQKVLGK